MGITLLVAKILTGVLGAVMLFAGYLALSLSKVADEPEENDPSQVFGRILFPVIEMNDYGDFKRFVENWKVLRGPRNVFMSGVGLLLICFAIVAWF